MIRDIVSTALVLLCINGGLLAADAALDGSASARRLFGNLPLYFIENQGQIDCGDVAFYVKGADRTLYFTPGGITIALKGRGDERWTVQLSFVGTDPVAPVGRDKQEAVFSCFKGRHEDWKTGLRTYGSLIYRDLWPGIDLVYCGTFNRLKYAFVVHPGADPGRIRLAYRGVTDVSLMGWGALKVTTPIGSFEDGRPHAFQTIEGDRKEVSMSYALGGRTGDGGVSYGFDVGPYDPERPLVLDPALLIYCGYIGGSAVDVGYDIAIDGQGNAYVTGYTESDETTFPAVVGPGLIHGGERDAFVAKVNAQGTALVYCGYIGGGEEDWGYAIAVDGQGSAYVTGETESDETSFPVTVGPDLVFNGIAGTDAFVAKVNPSGTGLDYCGYIGGQRSEEGHSIAVDGQGSAFVMGATESDESSFPVTIGPDLTFNGIGTPDAFVAKVDASGTGLVYCGYIGGREAEYGRGIAVDDGGNAYVTGETGSNGQSFPVAVGPDLTYNGGYEDVFVAKVNAQGTGLDYCGYIGGSDWEWGHGIAVDGQGHAYMTGFTDSEEWSFPVAVGPDLTFDGRGEAFVVKVNAQGTGLDYCGYIGGSEWDWGGDIAVDGQGNAYVTGFTESDESTFPVAVGPDLTFNGMKDAFVARVNASGTGLDYCGYIGGSKNDSGNGIAVDEQGNVFVAGEAPSDETTFPVTVGPDLTFNGSWDAFVAKVPPYHLLLRAGNVNAGGGDPADVLFVNGSAGSEIDRRVVVPSGSPVTVAMETPPAGWNPSRFTLYAWVGEPGPGDVAVLPYEAGTTCFPTPLSTGTPWRPPITIVNNMGYYFFLGYPVLPMTPWAPTTIGPYFNQPGTYTLQGLIMDSWAGGYGGSVTNAVVVEVQ